MTTAFLTDFYELTMNQAAFESGAAQEKATFELFARRLPAGRQYGVVGGMARAIEAVKQFRFTEDQIAFLRENTALNGETLDFLKNYRFTGNLYGYRDGDLYFPYSPILTVEGTFADAVILETVLLSILNHDSAVASAASRMVQVAAGRFPLIEMGSRRTHEMAAVDSARVAYLTGFAGTSNVEAGYRYGVPITGTAAHAFTLAHESELEAFKAQVKALGVDTTLLVDTYDIEQGIRNAVAAAGPDLGGIRIDSGDLHEEPRKARALLDRLGAHRTRIVVSSDIDEFSISEIVEKNTPVDGVGAGTRVVTGSGHPTAGMVFKLVEREGPGGIMVPVAKRASGKKSVGGRKFAYRRLVDGFIAEEFYSVGEPLPMEEGMIAIQHQFIESGEQVFFSTLEEDRAAHAATMELLPASVKSSAPGETFIEAKQI